MSETAVLVAAKLLPPARGAFHRTRERLHRRMAEALAGRVTVVLGGPGYGKTSLVARFLEEAKIESVWLRLDASDRDAWALFRYLVEAVRKHAPEFGERSAGLWESLRSRPDEVERLADLFIRDAEESLGGRLIVVLDGVEALKAAPACSRALRRLFSYVPPQLHFILTAHSLPDLGISALASQGEATVLQGEELRFTQEETRALLTETFGLRADEAVVASIHARTRGWVTALQLLRQTARLGGDSDLAPEVFDRSEVEIFEYFSEEVLAGESEETREFLLVTSLLPVLDPDLLAEAIEGCDARGMLARLRQRSLFLSSLGERGDLHAYDPLFRDFLRRKLRADRGAREVQALHGRFALPLLARKDFAGALVQLLAAQDAKAIADLLAGEGRSLLATGAIDEVREASRFCLKEGACGPVVEDLLGEACRLTGDYAAAIGHFERALAQGAPGELAAGRRRAAALQGLAYSLLKTGDSARATEVGESGLVEAGTGDPALTARILNTLSIIRYRENQHEAAIAGWEKALALAREGGDEHLTLMIAHNLGLPYAVTGEFRRAAECFRLLTRDDNVRLGPEEGAAYLNLARIAILRGEYARAASVLDDAREIAQKWKLQALGADVLEAEGTLLRETSHFEAAGKKYAAARALFTSLGLLDVLGSLAEEEAILFALAGEPERAGRAAQEVVARARAAGDRDRIASALLALGELHARSGEAALAEEPLEEAAKLFAASGHVYEQCMAQLYLALARARRSDTRGARRAAEDVLRLGDRFDYDGAIARVISSQPELRKIVGGISWAPSFLIEPEPDAAAPPTAAVQPDRADLTVRLLGPAEVYRDPERRIPQNAWKVRKAFRILCYLAASRNHRATKDRLVETIWGDADPEAVEKNFHPTISFLRRALNHGHHVPKSFVLCEAGAYRLNPAYRYDIDAETFEATIQAARRRSAQEDAAGALEEYARALDLHRGSFLEDEDDAWATGPRAHYDSLHLAALVEAGQLHLAKGDAQTGLALLARRVEHDPADEESSVQLMKALAARGQAGAVEKEYRRLEKALLERSSETPGPAARRAYRLAVGGDPSA